MVNVPAQLDAPKLLLPVGEPQGRVGDHHFCIPAVGVKRNLGIPNHIIGKIFTFSLHFSIGNGTCGGDHKPGLIFPIVIGIDVHKKII